MSERRPRIRTALLVVREGRLLLIQHRKNGESYWLVPGGGVEFGESLTEALAREILEETGCRVSRTGPLVFCHDTIAPDLSRHIVNLYFSGDLSGEPVCGREENLTAVDWFRPEEIAGLDMRPPVQQQLTAWLSGSLSDSSYIGPLWR